MDRILSPTACHDESANQLETWSTEKEQAEHAFIPVFVKRTDGAGPMTDEEAQRLANMLNDKRTADDYHRDDDPINHPSHYTHGSIEVWDFIVDQQLGFLAGNVITHLCRAGHKGDKMTDLRKAKAYLDKLIECEARDE